MKVPDLAIFLQRWRTGPLLVYVGGMLLPLIAALTRSELMIAIGVPAYTVLFWAGPFISAAAVIWTDWSIAWRAVWILLVPVISAATLALVFVVLS